MFLIYSGNRKSLSGSRKRKIRNHVLQTNLIWEGLLSRGNRVVIVKISGNVDLRSLKEKNR